MKNMLVLFGVAAAATVATVFVARVRMQNETGTDKIRRVA